MITKSTTIALTSGKGTLDLEDWTVQSVIAKTPDGVYKQINDYSISDNVLTINTSSVYSSADVYLKEVDASGTFVDYSDETVVDNVKDKITSVGKVGDSDMIPTYAAKGSDIGGDEFVYSSCKNINELANKNKEYTGQTGTLFTTGPLGGTTVSTNLMSMENFTSPTYRSKIPFGNVTVFNSDLPSLTDGSFLFYQNNLTSFTGNLDKLSNGNYISIKLLKEVPSDLFPKGFLLRYT